MTLTNTTVKARYTGDGSTTEFAIPFTYYAEDEVRVVVRDESSSTITETLQTRGLGNDYTLTGGSATALPTIVKFATAPASTDVILIKRMRDQTQETDYANNSDFAAEDHEASMDKIVALIQELNEEISRTPKLRETTSITDLELPQPVADRFFKWNATGTAIEYSETASETANAGFGTQDSDTISNNVSSATSISGMGADSSLYSSAIFEVEVDRSTDSVSLFGNQKLALQYKDSAWVLTEGEIFGGEDHGVTWSVTESGGIATIQYQSTNMAGSNYAGTIKWKRMTFAV